MKLFFATLWTRISFILSIIGLISITDNLIEWSRFIKYITDQYILFVRVPLFDLVSYLIFVPEKYHDLIFITSVMWGVASVGLYIKRKQSIFHLTFSTLSLIIRAVSIVLNMLSGILMCIIDRDARIAFLKETMNFWHSLFADDAPKMIPYIVIPLVPAVLGLGSYAMYAIFVLDENIYYLLIGSFIFVLTAASVIAWEWVLVTLGVFSIIAFSNLIYMKFLI